MLWTGGELDFGMDLILQKRKAWPLKIASAIVGESTRL